MYRQSALAAALIAVSAALAVAEAPVPEKAVVLEFRQDLSDQADSILSAAGLTRLEHPDLLPNQRMVRATSDEIESLRSNALVAAAFPASEALAAGVPVYGCAGPAVQQGRKTSNVAASVVDGWGRGVSLTWSVASYPGTLATEDVNSALEAALGEWARHAALRFTRTGQTRVRRNLEFLFGSGDHGDSYPFPANRAMLAHAFYPSSVNPEPIAGDVHFNTDESWSVGGERDLYSAALHEIGHALGLAHSGAPGSVMYPYYRELTILSEEDIADLQSLYGPPQDQSFALSVSGPASLTDESVDLNGTVSGGTGDVYVLWSVNGRTGVAEGGRSWTAASIPLVTGDNRIELSATDLEGHTATFTHLVTRTAAVVSNAPVPPAVPASPRTPVTPALPSGGDRVNPTLSITTPGSTIYATSASVFRVAGTARDNVAVVEVTWEASGTSGVAQGTTSWNAEVPLMVGDNTVIVRARDAAGNTAWRTLLVVRR